MDRDHVFRLIRDVAHSRGIDPASLTMDEIAEVTGTSRSSLYRWFGSRKNLIAEMEEGGFEVGNRVSAEDRLIVAAHAVIIRRGVQALTLESVAVEAGVAVPTVYARFGNRARLMRTVFTRYSPIPAIMDMLPADTPANPAGYHRMIESVYRGLWDFLDAQKPLVLAIVAEVIRDPESEVMDWLRTEYLPRVIGHIFPVFIRAMHAGMIRPGNPVLIGQSLVSPLIFHYVSRPILAGHGIPLPGRDEVCTELAAMFCRATLLEGDS